MEMNSCTPESSADFDQKKAKKTKKKFLLLKDILLTNDLI